MPRHALVAFLAVLVSALAFPAAQAAPPAPAGRADGDALAGHGPDPAHIDLGPEVPGPAGGPAAAG